MIYVMQECRQDGRLKIGYSENPEDRRKAMQTGNSSRLALVGAIPGNKSLERSIHRCYSYLKSDGGQEWFKPAPELLCALRLMGFPVK